MLLEYVTQLQNCCHVRDKAATGDRPVYCPSGHILNGKSHEEHEDLGRIARRNSGTNVKIVVTGPEYRLRGASRSLPNWPTLPQTLILTESSDVIICFKRQSIPLSGHCQP